MRELRFGQFSPCPLPRWRRGWRLAGWASASRRRIGPTMLPRPSAFLWAATATA